MAKVEKLINIECSNCGHIFIEKVEIKTGTEGTEQSEIDIRCPKCNALLTVTIEGKLALNEISLRKFSGKVKKL